MKSLTEYIKEQKSHIRNIYIIDDNLNEKLNDIDYVSDHVNLRKIGADDASRKPSTNIGGVTNKNIYRIFEDIDYIILEGLELNKIKNTNKYQYDNNIGVTKGNDKESIMIIGYIVNYDSNENKYDIHLSTVGRRDSFQKISNVKLRIYIKGNYKKIDWNVPKCK